MLWKLAYGRWPARRRRLEPGYTLLLTVPPDLPVFLNLAIDVCSRQDCRHLVQTLVIPDRPDRAFRRCFEQARRWWPQGNLRLVEMGPIDRLVRRNPRTASTIHWLQLVNGIARARSTHVLLHDVDLFISEPWFFRTHYETCVAGGLWCAGVDKPWSGLPWTADPRFQHVAACWELMLDMQWVRSLTPDALRPQRARIDGQEWPFETTLLAQALAPPERIGRLALPPQSVHFQFVIGTYRAFQAAKEPYEDRRFCLLLIRLLIDLYDAGRASTYALPTLDEMVEGLTDCSRPVFFRPEHGSAAYAGFRAKLHTLLNCGLVGGDDARLLQLRLQPFDRAFGWNECPVADRPAAVLA